MAMLPGANAEGPIALLDRFLHRTGPATADALAAGLACAPGRVQADIDALVASGCRFDHHPQSGIRLRCTALSVWRDYLTWRDRRRPSRPIVVYRQTASTQDVVRHMVDAHGRAADGALAICDEQVAGRGRLGRRWFAPPGTAVLFSRAVVQGPGSAAASMDRLMLAGAVAVARSIERMLPTGADVRIRWPNDVLLGGSKVAGILAERFSPAHADAGSAAVIGIGINVSLDRGELARHGLPDEIASLRAHGARADRLRILAEAIAALDTALETDEMSSLVAAWQARSVLLSRVVTMRSEGRTVRGRVVALDPVEGLVIRLDDGSLAHLRGATTTLVAW